ncbi:MAG: radical SAM protein [Candidatus Sumerlaeota bacterium]|nr:radical SAM protein [Candidatus Sumerlaeota bacterium]
MKTPETSPEPDPTASASTVYGPVKSWRVGWSLGVDLIQDVSTCSFNCIYCQLGDIQTRTAQRRVYVPTVRVLADLEAVDWRRVDVVALSGSGEPTLALNLGEVLRAIRARHGKPTVVLTNALHLHDPRVRRDLAEASEVAAKLDAADDRMLGVINRPVESVSVRWIVEGIRLFRREFAGRLCIQTMLMPSNIRQARRIAELIREIQPDEAQLNTPRRFYPLVWRQENRGRHVEAPPDYPYRRLRTITPDQMREVAEMMRKVAGVKTVTVFRV